jgi:hypothetical protein
MKRILREQQQPRAKSIRGQTQRLQEEVAEVQQQFNDLIERMVAAKIALEQLATGSDEVAVGWQSKTTDVSN